MKSSLVFVVCLLTTAAAQTIQNNAACDNTSNIGATGGQINSTNHPGNYYNDLNCSYNITISSHMMFTFQSFDTEACCDYVTISCPNNPSFPPQQFSGYAVPGFRVWISWCYPAFINFRTDGSGVSTGFSLNFNYMQDGGDSSHNVPSGVISSPNYPGNYYDDLDWEYFIFASTGSSISLIFKSFDVEESYDYITIYCEYGVYVPYPIRYSGDSLPDAVSCPSSEQLRMIFHTDYTTAYSGFSLNYYVSVGGCGNTVYTGSNGYVTTVNYPNNHPYNQNCSNIIWARERSTFYLNFESFFLDSCCNCDWLEIRCIDNSDYGPYKFCGTYTSAVNMYIHQCSQVLLWFHSDGSNNLQGFKIEYTVYPDAETTTVAGTPDFTQTTYTPPVSTLEPACKYEHRYGPSGVITSPNYPGNYYNNLSCEYYIYATRGSSIAFIFKDFHVQDYPDSLRIDCPANSSFPEQHYSGHTLPPPLSIPWCSKGSLYFYTDSNTSFSGFNIDYYVSDGDCGYTVHKESIGNVTSPNYPSNYSYYQNCSNIIWAPQRSYFILNFLFFELQDCESCAGDWVEISCLDYNPSRKYRFCGTSYNGINFSYCTQVLVLFHSDGSNNYQGFNLEYSFIPVSETTIVAGTGTTFFPQTTQTSPISTLAPGCDAFYCGPSGTITSPNYPGTYDNSLKCNYHIYASTGSSITLVFEHFDMEDDKDYITISCETNASFPEQRYSGHTLPQPLLIPWCSQGSLYFNTDTDTVYSGFSIDFYVNDLAGCGNTVYTGSAGNVTSPKYPSYYAYYLNCSNIIWAPQRSHFHLNFQYLYIESCELCSCDWVEISCLDNNPSNRHRFCGSTETALDLYQCTQVLVWFHSDSYSNFQGFDLNYNVYPESGCGDESYYGPSGNISSPNYPDYYDDSLYCDYNIYTSTSSSSIAIIFQTFNTEECCDYVTVSCPTNSSYSPMTYSGSSLPQSVSIPWCSQGRVNLRTDSSVISTGFSLDYYVSLGGCGDTVYTGLNGIVSSPNYPNNYGDNQNCSNILWAHKVSFFNISFLHMDLEECCDFVELSCLDNPAYGKRRFTGDSIPPLQYISECTQVLVWFFSDDSNVYKGFNLEYFTTSEPGCGCESYYGPSGVISSANYPDYYNDSLYCDYNIYTSSSSATIAIVFQTFNTEECCDHVTISCPANSSYSPVTYSGSSLPQPVLIPWCSQGSVNFHSDDSVAFTGFILDIHISLGGCGDILYTGVHGYISSPNYPNNYGDNQNCSNILWAYKPTSFNISFLHMNLEECCDFVELSCVDNPSYGNHRFTGESVPRTQYIHECTQVLVWFFTDDSNVYEGFTLEYYSSQSSDDINVLDNGKPNAAEKVPSKGKPNAEEKVPSNGKPNPAEKVPSNGTPNPAEKVPSNGKPNPAEKVPSNGKPNPAEKVNSNGKPKAAEK